MDIAAGIGTALGFFLGILGHEISTHQVAARLGDRTPRLMGRLASGVRAHADPLGSYIFPAVFVVASIFSGFIAPPFGWGKRHSIDPRTLRASRRKTILISLSGPLVTAAIAIGAAAVVRALPPGGTGARIALWVATVNISLTVFELLPIPGRDGGRILAAYLSPHGALRMEELVQYEVLFLIGLFFFLGRVANGLFLAGCRVLTALCDTLR